MNSKKKIKNFCIVDPQILLIESIWCETGETEEDFATRLATNLENLILKEGPETVEFLSPKLVCCQ
jgi:hypothetical protein